MRAVLFLSALLVPVAGFDSHQISQSSRGAYEASLAVSRSRRAAVWYDTRNDDAEVYFRLLDTDGRPSGPERRLTNGSNLAYEPDIVAVNENFAVTWYEKEPATGRLFAKLGLFTPQGRSLWVRGLSAPEHDGRNPVVRYAGNEIFCAWLEGATTQDPDVWVGWFSVTGEPSQPPRRVAAASRTTWNLNAAVDSVARAWVVFDAQAGTRADELFLLRVDKMATDLTRVSTDDGAPSKYPDLAFSGTRAALTWFDERDGNQEVYLFVAPVDDLIHGLDSRARRVTNTPGESIGAYVAWNGKQIGLAWCDNTEGQHEIYFERFDPDGGPLEGVLRLTRTRSESMIPAVRAWRDGFGVLWNEFQPGPGGAHDPNGRSNVMFSFVAAR